MICPRCNASLNAMSLPSGELFYVCPHQDGQFISAHSFRQLQGAQDLADVIMTKTGSQVVASDKNLACPQCRTPMINVNVDGRAFFIDHCERCQFIWFDAGEIDIAKQYAYRGLPQMINPGQEKGLEITIDENYFVGSLFPFYLEDTTPLRGFPAVTVFMLAIMVVCLAKTSHASQETIERYLFNTELPLQHYGMTLLSNLFFHANWLHLIGNSIPFILFGSKIEDVKGPWFLVFVFLIGGIAGNIAMMLFGPPSLGLGASGGIFALEVYYLIICPHARISISHTYYFYFKGFLRVKNSMPAWMFLFYNVGEEFFSHIVSGATSHIGHLAHLGGAFVGVLLAGLFPMERN